MKMWKVFVKKILLVGVIGILSGCATYYPLPIQEPQAQDSSGNRTTPDYQRGGLIPAKDIDEAKENLIIYGDAYQDHADKLRNNEYVYSDLALAGGVIGVVGGLITSAATAITGAAIASGATIASQRYQFLLQATNYQNASDAMYCMYLILFNVKTIQISPDFINQRIDQVRRKLRIAQSSVQLVNPDLAKLEAAIKQRIEAKENVEGATAALNKAGNNAAFTLAQSALIRAEIELLETELTKCVAAF